MSQEGKRARVEVRWMLGREENGKNWRERREWEELEREERMERIGKEWKRIGRIEKSVIPIFLIQLVTICNRLIH